MKRHLATIQIDGYDLKSTEDSYRRWRFKREDRVVRTAPSPKCLYVTSAVTLRKRLNEAGYDRTSLELEFLRYMSNVFTSQDAPLYFFDYEFYYGKYSPLQRAEAYRQAGLNDWLLALKESVANGWGPRSKPSKMVDSPCKYVDVNILIDMLASNDVELDDPIKPEHALVPFPCASLDCMAVAMLEVVRDDAECVLDVTELVENNRVYSFDDLLPALETNYVTTREKLRDI
ncbi:UNVERIFIED_ORG: hypothetical protein BDU10_5348 [Burkholderia sp. CF145]